MATSAAYQAFTRTYANPGDVRDQLNFTNNYGYLWSYYNNSALEDLTAWSAYKNTYGLYRYTRNIYNPYTRLVDFYAGSVYPGVLTNNPDRLPDGVQNALPLDEDTPDAVQAAIYQAALWSNFQEQKDLLVVWGAALGNVLVEVIDDMEREKVYIEPTWPGLLDPDWLELNNTGDVLQYALEYEALGDDDRPYTYRKEVTKDSYTFYRDQKVTESYPNPYGFVPAAWVKHRNIGEVYGMPAMRNIQKMDELNSYMSHIVDDEHKLLAAPVLIAGSGAFARLDTNSTDISGASSTVASTQADRTSKKILKGPQDASIQSIAHDHERTAYMVDKLIAEIEDDHPELTFYNTLREMSQVTGPAAARLSGDVWSHVGRAQASYDLQVRKCFQMCITISGWRLRNGWTQSTRQQQAFAPFDLESYDRGDLEFDIMPRPLITPTAQEQLKLEREQLAVEQDRQGGFDATAALRRVQERAVAA